MKKKIEELNKTLNYMKFSKRFQELNLTPEEVFAIGFSVERGELIAKEGKYFLEKRVVKLLMSVPLYKRFIKPVCIFL